MPAPYLQFAQARQNTATDAPGYLDNDVGIKWLANGEAIAMRKISLDDAAKEFGIGGERLKSLNPELQSQSRIKAGQRFKPVLPGDGEDLTELARVVYSEAETGNFNDMHAVASVVFNRVKADKKYHYPTTVMSNLTGDQFNGRSEDKYKDAKYPLKLKSISEVKYWNLCVRAVEKAKDNPLPEALIFHSYPESPDLPVRNQYATKFFIAFKVETGFMTKHNYFGLRDRLQEEAEQIPIPAPKRKGKNDR